MKKHTSKQLAVALHALGDPKRLKLLCALFKEPRSCVSELAAKTRGSVAITSHHLRALAQAGLLTPQRTGKQICYHLKNTPLVTDIKKLICTYH